MTSPASTSSPRPGHAAPWQIQGALACQVARVLALDDCSFIGGFAQMVAAVEAGLRREEASLETRGYRHLRERRAEHAILLCALHRVAARVERGDLEAGRQASAALLAMLSLRRCASAPLRAGMPRPQRRRRSAARERRHR